MLSATFHIVTVANLAAVGNNFPSHICYYTTDTAKYYIWRAGINPTTGLPEIGLGALEEVFAPDVAVAGSTSTVKHIVKYGVALTKGQAVYVSSANGTNMIVSKASNATEATSSKTMGLVDASGAINTLANVITEGLQAGLNTFGATEGDPVWLGTNGNLLFGLANKPVAPAHMVFIGIVTRASATNGEIFVKVQNGYELEELHNVLITSVADKNVLSYNSATGLWKNDTAANALGFNGTINAVPRWISATTLGNSLISSSDYTISINATLDGERFINTIVDSSTAIKYGEYFLKNNDYARSAGHLSVGKYIEVYNAGSYVDFSIDPGFPITVYGDSLGLHVKAGTFSGISIGIKAEAVGATNYAIQLKDDSSAAGKFLKSIDADGLAQWYNITNANITGGTSGNLALWGTTLTDSNYLKYVVNPGVDVSISAVDGVYHTTMGIGGITMELDGSDPTFFISNFYSDTAATAPYIALNRGRGSLAAPATVTTNDILGEFYFGDIARTTGFPTSWYKRNTARISTYATESHANVSTAQYAGTAFKIETIKNGINQSLTERFLIGGDGKIKISGAYTLPDTDGTVNQVLTTNGFGVLSWATASGGGSSITGAGVAGKMAHWTSATNISYNNYINSSVISNDAYFSVKGGNDLTQIVLNKGNVYSSTAGNDKATKFVLETFNNNAKHSELAFQFQYEDPLNPNVVIEALQNHVLGKINFYSKFGVFDTNPELFSSISCVTTEDQTFYQRGNKLAFQICKNGTTTLFNSLLLDSDGRVKISNAYKLPLTDGSPNQVLKTNGLGDVSWGSATGLTLTTTGTSGAATLVGSTLNIPQYSGGGGSVSQNIINAANMVLMYNS